ncbi:sulfur oxidation c-type cytochrome SoxX [Polynucleobacter sp. 78F-HAINBA]|jgi:sulfur-oxidizing protein SoxX|uniref:sulfur oxidation c-type cytochrome SoxX n=1 Tax=unclassified Polynucleobacter TaxID=2640945 RepID=UPI001B5B0542|nr:sulfur oxidation c-type cytochrome SoxX [Polynucleobacter sp. 78F-HAINBA]MBP7942979.1 sulfur oxidation c-type cytochrome SoxX [Polynucleobacter sp.]MBU3587382.1 sulfur oxidation c-type cytochrome SoxX [Polynucleobacter sp. 31A-FELB]MBU3590936.1 sulfur oxidation c-type cytochrome SoxX [Polynucleobacter sp. 78F-HAINBA]MBU3636364.1 sulfur oxidation c-type cytochrome SoxX [Polynucleobacter sp. es-MAR-4]
MKMTHLKQLLAISGFIFAAGLVQTPALAQQKNDPKFNKMMQDSFRAQGIAGLDRIDQDATQKFCSDPQFANSKQGEAMREKIQKMNMDTIQQPSDGKYIGDWKNGEKIAQSGRGATWSDKADTVIGGGCYNCHQIDPKEISYGTIGPSLSGYGKMRGYSPEVITYTWNRINNAKAYNACSNMPRIAHFKLLNEKQIQDVMALLLDPESPVNK